MCQMRQVSSSIMKICLDYFLQLCWYAVQTGCGIGHACGYALHLAVFGLVLISPNSSLTCSFACW